MFPERSDPTLSLIQKYVRGEQRGGGEGEEKGRGGQWRGVEWSGGEGRGEEGRDS